MTDRPPTAVTDVNCHLVCSVCQGYLVDATTITECLHSFCRSCVVPHVAEFHQCPSCSVPLSSTKPFSQLRRDYTLQSIVYKMVPRLARNELERRKQFLLESDNKNHSNNVNKTEERYLQSFFAPNDPISLSLEYADPNCEFGLRAKLVSGPETDATQQQHRRFFRCPADLPIGHLVKFLRCKFNVMDSATHKLEILYNGRPLASEYKLSDVAYIFSWKEREPLRLWYRISPSKKVLAQIEEPIQRKTTDKRASLVDITSKRSWQCGNGGAERSAKAKRRKRTEKIQRPESVTDLYPNKMTTIFDESRPAEFSCSTPIPAPVTESESTTGNQKVQNWLPKAVFDLDDRALFAKRLQRITNPAEQFRPESKIEQEQEEKPLLDPLRICVTSAETNAGNDEIHDSIGALDLSGSKCDSSTDSTSAPLSAGSCRSSSPVGPSKMGPHPYFMTPSAVYHHVQQQDPAQSMAALAAAAAAQSTNKIPGTDQDPWDLFQLKSPAHGSQSKSLLSLLNPLLFGGKKKALAGPPNSV